MTLMNLCLLILIHFYVLEQSLHLIDKCITFALDFAHHQISTNNFIFNEYSVVLCLAILVGKY